jgi:CRP/FNR family transcriptional regulator
MKTKIAKKKKDTGEGGFADFNVKAFLEHTDLFGPLSDKSKELISSIAVVKQVEKNQALFTEGEKGFALFLLASGAIQVSKSTAGARDAVIKIVRPGELFAEVILFEENTYPASATALKKSVVFMFPRHAFLALLENAFFRNDFIVLLIRKQRYLIQRIRYFSIDDIVERLHCYLKENYGVRPVVQPGVSKKDFAAALGITPETLSRTLARLSQQKLLSWQGNKLMVSDAFWRKYREQ